MLIVFRTEINVGGQDTFAYTADEVDSNGKPINYLNNTQLAELIGLDESTTRQNRLSKELKAMLGEKSISMLGYFLNKTGAMTRLSLWTMDDAAIYFLYHAQKGNLKAIDLLPFFPIDSDKYKEVTRRKRQEKLQTKKSGFIYLLDSGTVLKLGYSTNVKSRIKSLQRWEGELELVTTVIGTLQNEQTLHQYLKATGDSFGDEWYPSYRKLEILNVLQIKSFNKITTLGE
jgi:hypothetical protein